MSQVALYQVRLANDLADGNFETTLFCEAKQLVTNNYQNIDDATTTYSQIFIIDGDALKKDPITVVNKMQRFIQIHPYIDYNTKLR